MHCVIAAGSELQRCALTFNLKEAVPCLQRIELTLALLDGSSGLPLSPPLAGSACSTQPPMASAASSAPARGEHAQPVPSTSNQTQGRGKGARANKAAALLNEGDAPNRQPDTAGEGQAPTSGSGGVDGSGGAAGAAGGARKGQPPPSADSSAAPGGPCMCLSMVAVAAPAAGCVES